jgi:hypothetical protein
LLTLKQLTLHSTVTAKAPLEVQDRESPCVAEITVIQLEQLCDTLEQKRKVNEPVLDMNGP